MQVMGTKDESASKPLSFNCPLPGGSPDSIQMGHGGGGRLTQELIDSVFLSAFASDELNAAHDGASLLTQSRKLAFSTDSHVVKPMQFPGGDIGSLAIHGTANDLAMCGARPHWMSAGFILEEGLPIELLRSIVHSMKVAADEIGIRIVTGDTKVVERGKGDGIYINTSGIGEVVSSSEICPASIKAGDVVLLSGDIGRHGMAIMAHREGLEFESPIESDSAHLWPAVEKLIGGAGIVHCLRDLTRGGLAAAVIEIAAAAGLGISLDESAIPVCGPVRGACELLGLDPLHVANEGRFIAILPPESADAALELIKENAPGGADASVIGQVSEGTAGEVRLRSTIGVERILDRPSGEQLPRIC